MPRILLTMCLFVSVGLSAQQVFVYGGKGEFDRDFPIDTAWCRINAIDRIDFVTTYTDGDRVKKSKGSSYVYFLKNGFPEKVINTDAPRDTIKPRCVLYYKFMTNPNDTAYIIDVAEHSRKRVARFGRNGMLHFFYNKEYYAPDGNIKEAVSVSGYIKDNKLVTNPSILYIYNYSGDLLQSTYSKTPVESIDKILNTEYKYIDGQVVSIIEHYGDGLKTESVVTYYSKGKKVKLK